MESGGAADSPEATRGRLRKAVKEIPAVLRYDYVVLNYDLEQAAEEIRSIIVAERVRGGGKMRLRQTCPRFPEGIAQFVENTLSLPDASCPDGG